MFQNLVASQLSSFLGAYIENWRPSQLQASLGVWNGVVDLHDVAIRKDALTFAGLPVRPVSARIGHLQLTIPWTNMTSAAVDVLVEDVDVVLCTDYDISVAESALRKSESMARRALLDKNKLGAKRRRPGFDAGFADRFLMSLLYNFRLDVRGLRLCLQDDVTFGGRSLVTMQVTWGSVVIEPSDEAGAPASISSDDAFAYKRVTVDDLQLQWNQRTVLESAAFTANIRLVKQAELRSGPRPPRVVAAVTCHNMCVHMSKQLAQDLSAISSAFVHFRESKTAVSVPAIRPMFGVSGFARAWWHYAFREVQRPSTFTWRYMRSFRNDFSQYVDLYAKELQLELPDDAGRASTLRDIESRRTVEQILLMRRVAENTLASREAQILDSKRRRRSSMVSWASLLKSFITSSNDAVDGDSGSQSDEAEPSRGDPGGEVRYSVRFELDDIRLLGIQDTATFAELRCLGVACSFRSVDDMLHSEVIITDIGVHDHSGREDRVALIHATKWVFDERRSEESFGAVSLVEPRVAEIRVTSSSSGADINVSVLPIEIVLSSTLFRLLDICRPHVGHADVSSEPSEGASSFEVSPRTMVDVSFTAPRLVLPDSEGAATWVVALDSVSISNVEGNTLHCDLFNLNLLAGDIDNPSPRVLDPPLSLVTINRDDHATQIDIPAINLQLPSILALSFVRAVQSVSNALKIGHDSGAFPGSASGPSSDVSVTVSAVRFTVDDVGLINVSSLSVVDSTERLDIVFGRGSVYTLNRCGFEVGPMNADSTGLRIGLRKWSDIEVYCSSLQVALDAELMQILQDWSLPGSTAPGSSGGLSVSFHAPCTTLSVVDILQAQFTQSKVRYTSEKIDVSLEDASIVDKRSVDPQYSNLLGKRDRSSHLLSLSISPSKIAAKVAPAQWVIVPRFVTDIIGVLPIAPRSTSNQAAAPPLFLDIDIAQSLVLLPRVGTSTGTEHLAIDISSASITCNGIDRGSAVLSSMQIHRASSAAPIDGIVDDMTITVNASIPERLIEVRFSPVSFNVGSRAISLINSVVGSFSLLAPSSDKVEANDQQTTVTVAAEKTDVCIGDGDCLITSLCIVGLQFSFVSSRPEGTRIRLSVSRVSADDWLQLHSGPGNHSDDLLTAVCVEDPDGQSKMDLNVNVPGCQFVSTGADAIRQCVDMFREAIAPEGRAAAVSQRPDTVLRANVNVDDALVTFSASRPSPRNASFRVGLSVAAFIQGSTAGSLDAAQVDITNITAVITRSLPTLSSVSLIIPAQLFVMLDRRDRLMTLHVPLLDTCLHGTDISDLSSLVSAMPSNDAATSSTIVAVKDILDSSKAGFSFAVDEARIQLVRESLTIVNEPVFKATLQQLDVSFSSSNNSIGSSMMCRANIFAETYNQILEHWEPFIEPWPLSVSLSSSKESVTVEVGASSAKVFDCNISDSVVGALQTAFEAALLSTSTADLRCISVDNRTGSPIRVRFGGGKSSVFSLVDPGQVGSLEFAFELGSLRPGEVAGETDRRRPQRVQSGTVTVQLGTPGDNGTDDWAHWAPIESITVDESTVNNTRVHLLSRAEVQDDSASFEGNASLYVTSHVLSTSHLMLRSPMVIRNSTPTDMCIRIESQRGVTQLMVSSDDDCPLPIWMLEERRRHSFCSIRPCGTPRAEFATLFTFPELHALGEFEPRVVQCGPSFAIAIRTWASVRKHAPAFAVVIEPLLSITNNLPFQLLCSIDGRQDTNRKLASGATVHYYEQAQTCAMRHAGSEEWSDPIPVADRDSARGTNSHGHRLRVPEGPEAIRCMTDFTIVGCAIRVSVFARYWIINRSALELIYGVKEAPSDRPTLCPGQAGGLDFPTVQPFGSRRISSPLPVWADRAPWYAFPVPRRAEADTSSNPALGLVVLARPEYAAPHLAWTREVGQTPDDELALAFTPDKEALFGPLLLHLRLFGNGPSWSSGCPLGLPLSAAVHVTLRGSVPHSTLPTTRESIHRMFDLGIWQTQLPSQPLTTAVTIAPRFIVRNETRRDVLLRQVRTVERTSVGPGQHSAVHRYDSRRPAHYLLQLCDFGAVWSGAVAFDSPGHVALRLLNKHAPQQSCIIRVDCALVRATYEIRLIDTMSAPYRIENISFLVIMFSQEGVPSRSTRVLPYHSKEFAWDDPMRRRRIVVSALLDDGDADGSAVYVGTFSVDRLGEYAPVLVHGHDRKLPRARELKVDVVAQGAVRVLRVFDTMLTARPPVPLQQHGLHALTFDLRLRLPAFGVSLVSDSESDGRRRELSYVRVSELNANVYTNVVGIDCRVWTGAIQVDNQTYGAAYPVVLQAHSGATVQFSISLQQSTGLLSFVPNCAITIPPLLSVCVEWSFLALLLASAPFRLLLEAPAVEEPDAAPRALSPVRVITTTTQIVPAEQDVQRLYCHTLSISRFTVRLSTTSTVSVGSGGPLQLMLRAAGASLANIEDAFIVMHAVNNVDVLATPAELKGRLAQQYVLQVMRESYKLVGSADFLGNPFALIANLSAGIADMVRLPAKGLARLSPWGFARGLVLGMLSMLRYLVFGFANASAKIARSFAKGAASLAVFGDPRPSEIGSNVLGAFWGSFVGVFREPWRHGVVRGTLRGATGVILLPLVAGANTWADVAGAIRSIADRRVQPERVRLPRPFEHGTVLRAYDFFPTEVVRFASALDDQAEFVVGFVRNAPHFDVIMTSENIYVVEIGAGGRVLMTLRIRSIFSLTTIVNEERTLHVEMYQGAFGGSSVDLRRPRGATIIDVGSADNARAVLRMFKFVRRRSRRLRKRALRLSGPRID
ncbi:unnamed protein product (mitochondrion) [Plasmodiophora brassicae]|uniref:Uncharacterized protein n=1 Tax=Plasmodiophora brassicae TaxID=37360 RepID=A0A0G4J8Y4_PLABS|nr:hypothetical protein PBRA_003471 [Plasmodiophora brassicae]SPQ99825.1 unnamed protein product [Plasmodiophora brassicae]